MSFETTDIEKIFNSSYTSTTTLAPSSIVTANDDPLTLTDIRRVFDGKCVVFAGDSQIRSIYRDLSTFLVTGHRLGADLVALQAGKRPTPNINEQRVCFGSRAGSREFVDQRVCQWSPSSSIHYIYLASLNSQETNELLRLVQQADFLVFSSARSDMSWDILSNLVIPFTEHLDNYASKVFSLCQRIVEVARSKSSVSAGPLLLWLTPIVVGTSLSREQKYQFLQIVTAGEKSAKLAGFQLFDQLNVSLADGGIFATNKCGNFTSIGIRLVTRLLAQIAADHWKRPLRILTSSSTLPSY